MMESQDTNQSQTEMSADQSKAKTDILEGDNSQNKPQADGIPHNSSVILEQREGNQSLLVNSHAEETQENKNLESDHPNQEKFIDNIGIGILGKLDMSQTNEKIYNNLGSILNWLAHIINNKSRQISLNDINQAWHHTNAALDLIERLLGDKQKLRNELEEKNRSLQILKHEKQQLEQANIEWQQENRSLNQKLSRITTERDNLNYGQQDIKTRYIQQIKQLQNQYYQKEQELARIQQEKDHLEGQLTELEASRDRLLAETASLKRNTGTHYDGTSDRPQHHVLISEYKTLKEQHLDPLANSLFNFLVHHNPELKQQRREKLNDIKAEISRFVLIEGQTMMGAESIASVELPLGCVEALQDLLCQKLQLNAQPLSSQTTELLTKAAKFALANVQYPVAGRWQEQDYQQASKELSNQLFESLKVENTSLSSDLKFETEKAIKNALHFLEKAALASPPAQFLNDKIGDAFRPDYHEAAKGWDDEGIIAKTIYPVYWVNGEAKVKAVVLTQPLGSRLTNDSDSSQIIKSQFGNPSQSNSSETKTTLISQNESEKEKIYLENKLAAKREALINRADQKWFEKFDWLKHKKTEFIDMLSKIDQIEIIEKLIKECDQTFDFNGFMKKLKELIAN